MTPRHMACQCMSHTMQSVHTCVRMPATPLQLGPIISVDSRYAPRAWPATPMPEGSTAGQAGYEGNSAGDSVLSVPQ